MAESNDTTMPTAPDDHRNDDVNAYHPTREKVVPQRIPSVDDWWRSTGESLAFLPDDSLSGSSIHSGSVPSDEGSDFSNQEYSVVGPGSPLPLTHSPEPLGEPSSLTGWSQEPTLPGPVVSPTPGNKRATSIAFEKPKSPKSSPLSAKSIYERRGHVRTASELLAKVTGRDKRMSELEVAEEGHSPYGGTFPAGEGDESGLKRRRVSQEPEDMV